LSYLPAYLHLRHGLSLSASSALIALYAVGGLVYAFTARRIVARYGEHRMVLSGGILMGLGFLILWLSPWWLTAGPDALMLGFGTYLFHNTLQTNATQMAPVARGTSVALFAFCLFGGQAIGVSLAGYTFDHFGATPMLLAAAVVLPLAGWWFVRALLRRQAT
jgi:predicted MFS family arabinose efflux permease